MKNELKYYYNIEVKTYTQKNNTFYFEYNNRTYIFTPINRSVDEIMKIYEISKILNQNGVLCHTLISNNNNLLTTNINKKDYVLMINNICSETKISLPEIIDFSLKTKSMWDFDIVTRTNWSVLWEEKIKNLEYQISQYKASNHPFIYSFGYYAGIVENDIQLFKELYKQNLPYTSICHKRITYTTSLNEFYNPLNFIIDYSIRDISEYLKSKMINNINVYDEINYFFELSTYNYYDKIMMFIRTLFPSYQLDIYEKCFFDDSELKNIEYILDNSNRYEMQLKKTYALAKAYINEIPYISWLEYHY